MGSPQHKDNRRRLLSISSLLCPSLPFFNVSSISPFSLRYLFTSDLLELQPVLVMRFITANTVDHAILKRAESKRKLEKLVIHKGMQGDCIKNKMVTHNDIYYICIWSKGEIGAEKARNGKKPPSVVLMLRRSHCARPRINPALLQFISLPKADSKGVNKRIAYLQVEVW